MSVSELLGILAVPAIIAVWALQDRGVPYGWVFVLCAVGAIALLAALLRGTK